MLHTTMIATFKFLTKPTMRKNLLLLAGCLLLLPLFTAAQSPQDPILFTVGNASVPLSEFKYVYTKTNQDKADFSEASIRDYLDLYVRFKLKVQNSTSTRFLQPKVNLNPIAANWPIPTSKTRK